VEHPLSIAWPDAVGLLGVAIILGCHFGLQAGRLRGDRLPYQLANIVGAGAIMVSLLYQFNLASFVAQIAWILITLFGIWRGAAAPGKGSAAQRDGRTP
jgi:hypothetical protein